MAIRTKKRKFQKKKKTLKVYKKKGGGVNEPYYNKVGNYKKNPLYVSANENIYSEIPVLKWQPGEVYNTTASGPSHIRSRNNYNIMRHKQTAPILPPRLPPRLRQKYLNFKF